MRESLVTEETENAKPEERASAEEVYAAIELYTKIVEERLKPGLDSACEQRDKLFSQLEKIDVQKHSLETLRNAEKTVKTMANIGEEFYIGAEIQVEKPLILELIDGIMVEVNIREAFELIEERKELIEKLANVATTRIVDIQAHLKAVLSTISKLRESHGALQRQEDREAMLGEENW